MLEELIKNVFLCGSPAVVVKGGGSWFSGCEFESLH